MNLRDYQQSAPPKKGDYVLATKWGDGDPGDPWAVGFYAGKRGDRHYVVDSDGRQIRGNGYRRVARIDYAVGAALLGSAIELEESPAGILNLWLMLNPERE